MVKATISTVATDVRWIREKQKEHDSKFTSMVESIETVANQTVKNTTNISWIWKAVCVLACIGLIMLKIMLKG